MWHEFLFCHKSVAGESSRLSAIVYAHLGDLLGDTLLQGVPLGDDDPCESWFDRRKKKGKTRNFRLAEEAYEKALPFIRQTRTFTSSCWASMKKADDNGKRNKKLDEISRLFPDDKDVLARNGNYCIERKAYLKGIEYLKRAVALDPLARINRGSPRRRLYQSVPAFCQAEKSPRHRGIHEGSC